MSAWRGFRDIPVVAKERLVDLNNKHKPRDMQKWSLEGERYRSFYEAVEVQLEVLEDELCFLRPPLVVDTASTLHRKILDPLRKRLKRMAENEAPEIVHSTHLATLLLRFLEETSAAIAFQSNCLSLSHLYLEDEIEIPPISSLVDKMIIAGHIT